MTESADPVPNSRAAGREGPGGFFCQGLRLLRRFVRGLGLLELQVGLRERSPGLAAFRPELRSSFEAFPGDRQIIAIQSKKSVAEDRIEPWLRGCEESQQKDQMRHREFNCASARVAAGSPGFFASKRCMVSRARSICPIET